MRRRRALPQVGHGPQQRDAECVLSLSLAPISSSILASGLTPCPLVSAVVGVIAHASDNVPLVSEQGTNFAAVLAKPVTKDGVRLILHKLGFIEGLAAAAVGAGGSNGGGA